MNKRGRLKYICNLGQHFNIVVAHNFLYVLQTFFG